MLNFSYILLNFVNDFHKTIGIIFFSEIKNTPPEEVDSTVLLNHDNASAETLSSRIEQLKAEFGFTQLETSPGGSKGICRNMLDVY